MNLTCRLICFLMALQLLNCSVDAPDVSNIWTPEDLGYNEQESLIEILVEQVADWGDVIAEYDDDDASDETSGKKIAVDYFILPHDFVADMALEPVAGNQYFFRPNSWPQTTNRNFSPPPEA